MNKTLIIIAFVVIMLVLSVSLFITEVGTDYAILGISPFQGKIECNDLVDNDGDNFIDYPLDPGCMNERDRSESNPRIECDDGRDNDRDGAVDMEDYGCVSPIDVDETHCGDYVCEDLETCSDCPEDCGTCR